MLTQTQPPARTSPVNRMVRLTTVKTTVGVRPNKNDAKEKQNMNTTKRYPLTKAECESRIAMCVSKFGPNEARASFGYRKNACSPEHVLAFSFVESPRTAGAFREIGYCS